MTEKNAITKTLLVAAIGLAVAAALCIAVATLTSENDLMSTASPEAGLKLAPGNEGVTSMRKVSDKPVVVKVTGDKAVVQSKGSAPLLPGDSGSSGSHSRNSRLEDD